MRMPSHAALCSFTFSLLLTSALIPSSGNVALASPPSPAVQMAVHSALNGLRAEGFAGGSHTALPTAVSTPASAPAESAPAPSSGLTPELLNKLIHCVALDGIDRVVVPEFANALGLTSAGQSWLDRQLAARLHGEVINHAFATSRGGDQDLILFIQLPDAIHVFRVQRNGLVVAAFDMNPTTKQITQRAPGEAQAGADAEYAWWNSTVDRLLAGR